MIQSATRRFGVGLSKAAGNRIALSSPLKMESLDIAGEKCYSWAREAIAATMKGFRTGEEHRKPPPTISLSTFQTLWQKFLQGATSNAHLRDCLILPLMSGRRSGKKRLLKFTAIARRSIATQQISPPLSKALATLLDEVGLDLTNASFPQGRATDLLPCTMHVSNEPHPPDNFIVNSISEAVRLLHYVDDHTDGLIAILGIKLAIRDQLKECCHTKGIAFWGESFKEQGIWEEVVRQIIDEDVSDSFFDRATTDYISEALRRAKDKFGSGWEGRYTDELVRQLKKGGRPHRGIPHFLGVPVTLHGRIGSLTRDYLQRSKGFHWREVTASSMQDPSIRKRKPSKGDSTSKAPSEGQYLESQGISDFQSDLPNLLRSFSNREKEVLDALLKTMLEGISLSDAKVAIAKKYSVSQSRLMALYGEFLKRNAGYDD